VEVGTTITVFVGVGGMGWKGVGVGFELFNKKSENGMGVGLLAEDSGIPQADNKKTKRIASMADFRISRF
jgi:hypothetical protein